MHEDIIARAVRDEKVLARFWRKVSKTDGCWMWTAAHNQDGYGTFCVATKALTSPHRFSWAIKNGPVPRGMFVCHHCDVPACVNPDHLFLGTNSDNMRDRDAKGRGNHKIGEDHHKHRLTEKDIHEIVRRRKSETIADIARSLGVHRSLVGRILSGHYWKHVPR